MTFKPSVSTIRFFCMMFLPLSSRTQQLMSEAELIEWAQRSNWLTRDEIDSVPSRSDSRYANRVHNVVSHRDSRMNPILLGYIGWDQTSAAFTLNEQGMRFLQAVDVKLGGDGSGNFAAIRRWLADWASKKRAAHRPPPTYG